MCMLGGLLAVLMASRLWAKVNFENFFYIKLKAFSLDDLPSTNCIMFLQNYSIFALTLSAHY